MRQELVGQSLLEHLTRLVIADAVRIKKLLEVKNTNLYDLLAARIEYY